MWIDLIPKIDLKQRPVIKIEAPPRHEMELRVIIWETKNLVFKDLAEGCNDVYVRAGVSTQEFQETDIHWRCRNKGSFNWRMKFSCNFPKKNDEYGTDQFKIQIWDKDIASTDDLIGEVNIDLNTHLMIDKCVKRLKTVQMKRRTLGRNS
jgi:hypothetical protein